MKTARLEAFTDGVLAIAITITVLELKVPHGARLSDIVPAVPLLLAYAQSFTNVAIYWHNHHHLLHAATRVDGRGLWANSFMLFWLTLVPWIISWLDESGFASGPVAAYGVVLGGAGIGYGWLQRELVRVQGPDGPIARAVAHDWKGRLSVLGYLAAIPLAFVSPAAAIVLYIAITLAWLVPDRRIERALEGTEA